MEKPKLLDQLRDAIRVRHYSYLTEQTYVLWSRQYILFHGKRHPAEMGGKEIGDFLTYLAIKRKVSSSTQNQALNAIIFLYKHVLGKEIGLIDGVVRAKRSQHLPEVFTKEEVKAVLDRLTGQNWLMASLLYGTGLRLMECHRLRVKDIDFGFRQIIVRDGKGQKDRITMLPEKLVPYLEKHLVTVNDIYRLDLAGGFQASMPE